MANELTINKEQTARFVHDAVEMESAIFTLDRAIGECEQKKQEVINQKNNTKIEVTREEKRIKELKEYSLPTLKEKRKTIRSGENAFEKILGGMIVGAILGFIIRGIVSSIVSDELKSDLIMSVIPTIAALAGGICGFCIYMNSTGKEIKELERKMRFAQNDLTEYENRLNSAKAAEAERVRRVRQQLGKEEAMITDMISTLRQKRNQLQSTLTRFYNLGVIPPDYRYMDCAIMLDQIFRNDLADTMREAINKYEERVFRGEVIKGMDRICRMLGNLSAGMMAIEQRLSSIDSNVKMMSQDLYNFSQRIAAGQGKQQKATEELLEETRMNRYANERLAESAKNLEYFERRRNGWV